MDSNVRSTDPLHEPVPRWWPNCEFCGKPIPRVCPDCGVGLCAKCLGTDGNFCPCAVEQDYPALPNAIFSFLKKNRGQQNANRKSLPDSYQM